MNTINKNNLLVDREAARIRRQALMNAYINDIVSCMKSQRKLQMVMPEVVPKDAKDYLVAVGYKVRGRVITKC